MPILELPHADFFDSVDPLDLQIERARDLFGPSHGLSTSIASFMMWQDAFTYALTQKGPFSFVVALYGSYVYLPLPPQPFTDQSLQIAFEYMKMVNGPGPGVSRIEGLSFQQTEQAQAWGFASRLTIQEFLYDREKLIGLHGDAYRSKRSQINHFLNKNQVLLRPFRSKDLTDCGKLYEIWKHQRLSTGPDAMSQSMLQAAQKAHFHALHQGDQWGMDAWVVWVNQRLSAYTVGAALSPNTYGIYLEVTDLTIKGLSAYIFVNVCRQLESYRYINTGDAEGLPGLAQSKELWHPTEKLLFYAIDPS